jgi:hypothetical protein
MEKSFNLKRIKSKKSQGVFDMSFTMIFSIILIVFFIIVAFIAIKYFLNYQRTAQIGLFLDDFKSEVNKVFNSESTLNYYFNSTLPKYIEQVCIVNLQTAIFNATTKEKEIYDHIKIKENVDFQKNVYLYSPSKAISMKWKQIDNIKTISNPKCYPVIKGRVSIKMERNFENPYVLLR